MSGLLALIALIFVIVMQSRLSRLEKIVEDLARNGVASTARPASVSASVPMPGRPATAPIVPMPASQALSSSDQLGVSREPGIIGQFFHWCSIDWPMKLGALLLFLAFGWIIPLVFWDALGPVGQVSLGIIVGVLILLFGARRIETFVNQGSVILALGAGIIYIAIFAARFEYDIFTPVLALLFMFLVTVFVAFVSVIRRSFSLALLALTLGGVAPILTNSGHPDIFGLFSYLFVLMIGTLWVTRLTGWRNLTTAGIVLYALYAAPLMETYFLRSVDPDQSVKVLVAIVFATLFFIVNVLSIVYDRLAERGDLIVGLMNGLILLGWIGSIVPVEWRSLAAVLAALVASVGAYMIHLMTGLRQPMYIHSTVAIVFLGMATAYELSGAALVIAYALEVTALVLLAKFVLRSDDVSEKASVVAFLPVVLSLGNLSHYLNAREVFTKDFFAIILVIGMLWLFSILLRRRDSEVSSGADRVFFGAAVLYSLLFVWPFFRTLFQSDDVATTVSLLVYTVIGMYCYVHGKLIERKEMQRFGSILLLLVTAHLLLVDIWNMDVTGKIITFTIVGVLFMSTAFIGKHKSQ